MNKPAQKTIEEISEICHDAIKSHIANEWETNFCDSLLRQIKNNFNMDGEFELTPRQLECIIKIERKIYAS